MIQHILLLTNHNKTIVVESRCAHIHNSVITVGVIAHCGMRMACHACATFMYGSTVGLGLWLFTAVIPHPSSYSTCILVPTTDLQSFMSAAMAQCYHADDNCCLLQNEQIDIQTNPCCQNTSYNHLHRTGSPHCKTYFQKPLFGLV